MPLLESMEKYIYIYVYIYIYIYIYIYMYIYIYIFLMKICTYFFNVGNRTYIIKGEMDNGRASQSTTVENV